MTASTIQDPNLLSPSFVPLHRSPATAADSNSSSTEKSTDSAGDENVPLILPGTNVTLDSATATRPKAGGIAFPFKLGHSLAEHGRNASVITLKSDITAMPTPRGEVGEEEKGLGMGMGMVNKTGDTKNEGVAKDEVDGGARTDEGGEKSVRPGVERFETAQEDLT